MPAGSKGTNGTLHDGLTAAGTSARVALDEAFAADWFTILYIECGVIYLLIAMAAQKMLRMPGLAQGSDDALGDRLIALVANVVLLFGHTKFVFFCRSLSVFASLTRLSIEGLSFSLLLSFTFFSKYTHTMKGAAQCTHIY